MHPIRALAPFTALVIAVPCFADTVDFRIVELTGQSQVTASDHFLDFAVQARLNTTSNLQLSTFGFAIHMVGEPESAGTLSRGLISNSDGTYSPTLATNSVVGIGGLARQYAYLAGINATFNGVINTSSNTFTNGPDQEIGLVLGASLGSWLLGAPGIDVDQDGNPDAWPGNGTGATPAQGTVVTVSTAIARPYFARNQYIDLYHFRYNVTDLSTRAIHIALEDLQASEFRNILYNVDTWGPQSMTLSANQITLTPLDIAVPAPGPALALTIPAALMAMSARRRRNG